VHDGRGDVAGAREHYRQALVLWRRLGDRRGLARALGGLGESALLLGTDLDEAEAALNEAATVENELQDGGPGYATALARLALCYLLIGEPERAEACARQSVRVAREAKAALVELEALRVEAESLLARGDLLRGLDLLQRIAARPEAADDHELIALVRAAE